MDAYANAVDDADIDDENDWKAMDSDEEENKNENHDEEIERDDDVDIGFRSHQFQYGAHGRNRKRSRKENQEEAIYGVFYDGGTGTTRNPDNDNTMRSAPMFVPATRKPETSQPASSSTSTSAPPFFVAASKKEAADETQSVPAPMFVAASKHQEPETKSKTFSSPSSSEAASSMFVAATKASPSEHPETNEKETQDAQEEEERIAKEQKEADDRFLELLEKAKGRNKRTRPRPAETRTRTTDAEAPTFTSASASASASTATAAKNNDFAGMGGGSGLGMPQGLGLPTSFGGNVGGGLGFTEQDEAPVPKDPTVGTWEKHTKGFGSKLLAKMGWKGSGGLGSNRRKFRGESTAASGSTDDPTNPPQSGAKTSTTTTEPVAVAAAAAAAAPSSSEPQAVKKGISRPVEVVVRPANMGLGFGNFKEASQLKSNRRIEAEVRGIDYDAQLAKEKEELRAKRRQKRKQRYGVQYDSSTDEDEEGDSNATKTDNVRSSAIPTTDDLLSKQSWKAMRSGKGARGKKRKSSVPEIIPYQELIERQKKRKGTSDEVVIIDMRGPSSETKTKPSSSSNPGTVPLGEELLYNLSFLLGTYENKLHSSSKHYETSIQRTINGLDHQISDAKSRLKTATDRRNKLARAQTIVQSVQESLVERPSDAGLGGKKQKVNHLVSELKGLFTPEERRDLQFWNVLAPTLLGPVMEGALEKWKPFFVANDDGNGQSSLAVKNDRAIVDSFFEWAESSGGDNGGRILCESMVKNQLVPKLKADIEAEAFGVWDPVTNPYAVLDVYEYLRAKALAFDKEQFIPSSAIGNNDENDNPNQVFPSARDDEGDEDDLEKAPLSNLAEFLRHELIREAVYPKLQTAIANWKPTLPPQTKELRYPLHLWVLPWLPHIDHPILLPNLLVECKRKLKSALSVLQRGISSGSDSVAGVTSIMNLIRPWSTIMDPKSLQKMVSEHTKVLPTIENLLLESFSGAREEQLSGDGSWKNLLCLLFELHSHSFLSDLDFLSLLEGPFLATWARAVHSFLCGESRVVFSCDEDMAGKGEEKEGDDNNPSTLRPAINAYRECKIRVLVDPFHGIEPKSSFSCSRSLALLRRDSYICRMFYSVARMIQISRQSSSTSTSESKQIPTELDILEPEVQSFSVIRGRRSREEKEKLQHETNLAMGESRGESRAKAALRRRNILEPTFREVVEAFASEKAVVFRPKVGAERDGKPIYLFGNKAIYLEGDVVFCHDSSQSSWRPVSLDQLGAIASSG